MKNPSAKSRFRSSLRPSLLLADGFRTSHVLSSSHRHSSLWPQHPLKVLAALAFSLSVVGCDDRPASPQTFAIRQTDFNQWDRVLQPQAATVLQETDSCLMSYADKCVVTDRRIVFQDYKAKRIYAFDRSGKFVCRIGQKGHAASEYDHIWDIDTDAGGKELAVLDERGVLYYDLADGRYLRRERRTEAEKASYVRMAVVGEGEYLYLTDDYAEHSIVLADSKGEKGLRKKKRYLFVTRPFYRYGKECRVIADYGDFYIDSYHDGRLSTSYRIDLGSQALPDDVLPQTYDEFEAVDNAPEYFKFISSAQETSEWLCVSLIGPRQTPYIAFIHKESGRYVCGKAMEDFGLFVVGADESRFYAIVYPEYASPRSFAKRVLDRCKVTNAQNSPVIVSLKVTEALDK